MFAGTSSDVGKTTTVLGIMRALRNRGLKVQGYKAGPDYIDTAFHTFATGVPSRNLDPWMMPQEALLGLMARHEEKTDISILEGVMGMFDGVGTDSIEGSSAHLAKMTQTPVVLIINGKGVALSGAAMVLGFKMFDPAINIAGVIINRVSGDYHYNLIKDGIEKHVGIPCIGYLEQSDNITLSSRHLGLIPSVEVEALDEKVDQVAQMVESTIDLDLLMTLAKAAVSHKPLSPQMGDKRLRLGLAKDESFNFYYQDNLDLLSELGCDLVEFSPLKDQALPKDLHGLYIGGGFPEIFAEGLSANTSMRTSIKEAIQGGLPTYAECGGYMYLSQGIETLDQESYDMVGIFDHRAEMTKRLQRFGYVQPTLNQDTILGPKGTRFKGHEFHRSKMMEDQGVNYAYDIEKARRGQVSYWQCGEYKYKCLAAYAHMHFYSNIDIVKNFIDACLTYKRGVNYEE